MKVVLDTNILLLPFTTKINLDTELNRLNFTEIYVPTCVVEELKKLAIKNNNAKSALNLIHKYNNVITTKKGDLGVIEASEKLNAAVATNDKELRRILKEKSIIRVIPRQKSYLMVEK
ncbi:MAG: PIN domain-containing protein [Thermoplasmata archaeon]